MGRLRVDRICPQPPVRVRGADGREIVGRCHVATTRRARLVGLLGTPRLGDDEGLWLTRCGSVHTVGLRRPIAVALVGADGRVLALRDPLPPRRLLAARGAVAALEREAGGLAGRVAVGDHLARSASTRPVRSGCGGETTAPSEESVTRP